jgi:hypothetical protein
MAVALRVLLASLIAAFFLPSFWSLASAWVFNADLREVSNFSLTGMSAQGEAILTLRLC